MATYAPVAYTTAASNTQIDFDITFTFLRATDVVVSVIDPNGNVLVNGTDYDAELQTVNDGTFDMRVVQAGTLNTTRDPIAANHVVLIKRNTDISQIVTVFQDGASFKAADINAIITQLFDKIQEVEVASSEGMGLTEDSLAFDAENKPLRNLGAPVSDNDAVRKVDVDSGIGAAVSTVASIANDVTNVAADQADIGVVAADLSGSDTIGTVSSNIASVQNVSASIANVNLVSTDLADITTVASDIEVGGPDNIGTVAAGIGDVAIVAGINGPVQTVSTNIADVTTVATDLSGADNTGTVATNIASVNTLAGISSDVTSLAPQASNISTLTQAANLTALQNAQSNAQAAQAALNQLNNKYHGSFTNVNGDDAEVEAAIAADSDLSKEAGDLYFDSTNDKLRYYDGTGWYNAAATNIIDMTALSNAGDVASYTANLADGSFLVYDGANWVDETPAQARASIGLENIDDLSDVDTTGVASGELLRWDGTSAFVPTSLTEDASGNVVVGGDIKASSFNGGQLGGRRNLIINGAMQVAQRGTSFTSSGYTLDRIYSDIVNGTVTQDTADVPDQFTSALKFTTSSSSAYTILYQPFEASDFAVFKNKTVTVSGFVKASSGFSGQLYFSLEGGTIADTMTGGTWTTADIEYFTPTTTWQRFEATLSAPNSSGFRLVFGPGLAQNSGVSWSITGLQMELGDTATPFEHRSYGEELALCQRYYEIVGMTMTTAGQFDNAVSYAVPKRATPALSVFSGSLGGATLLAMPNNTLGQIRQQTNASSPSDVAIEAQAEL